MIEYWRIDSNGNPIENILVDTDNGSEPPSGYVKSWQYQDNSKPFHKPTYNSKTQQWEEGASGDELLGIARSNKINELRDSYNQSLLSGFNVTIGANTYTLGWSTDDKANLNAIQTAIDRSYQAFPIYYADINGQPIIIQTQDDLNLIEQTATKFAFAQHQQILSLVSQAQSATDQNSVDAIQWTPATY